MTDPMIASQTPVPSITLQITKKNGERFLVACEAVKLSLATFSDADDFESRPLHERLFAAAQQCDNPLVSQFLYRLKLAGLNEQETMGATLLFHESDKSVKLRSLFHLLSTGRDQQIGRSGAASLFRTVLTAISSGLQAPDDHENHRGNGVLVEGRPTSSSPERPSKKFKLNSGEGTVTTHEETDDDNSRAPCQSPSWDSSLATLRDEDDRGSVRKEIQDIASFAADELIKFAATNTSPDKARNDGTVDLGSFSSWYSASGGTIVPWIELLQLSKWKSSSKTPDSKENSERNGATRKTDATADDTSPGSLTAEDDDQSRTLVSFDFNGSGSPAPLLISISEDNLHALQTLVQRTNLMHRTASDICKLLLQAGAPSLSGEDVTILRKDDFRHSIRSIIPEAVYEQLSKTEKDVFDEYFLDFFSCFEQGEPFMREGEIDLKEFAVGFCFLCAGNKSTKLATGYELLDGRHRGYLTEDQLLRYLQSYLTMLVGMSLLTPMSKRRRRRPLTPANRKTMRSAIENGAKWTLVHFIGASSQTKEEYTFESFATWYSEGGYNIAPWLELLDLNKVMSLIADPSSPTALPPPETDRVFRTTERPRDRDRVSSLRRHHLSRGGPALDILFTFPLGNRRSLVVLKEDATYVRAVVEQLGLLSMKPDDLWAALSIAVEKRRPPSSPVEVATYVSIDTFVRYMRDICPRASRKRSASGSTLLFTNSTPEELLANFYQCFDIDQCDSVALDELMGGLTLLCGGKKSHKLAFAFSMFDTRPGVHGPGKKRGIVHSLSGEDLFLFLRSILIVTFSTCRQSLDLTDDMVGRCIADTANMICNDVMRHQWETKQNDRLDFDEFGQWYNDGGFERAPWLELLDLRKWVLIDDPPSHDHAPLRPPPQPVSAATNREMPILPDPSIPPPPPEDSLDANFFDTDAIMPLDSVSRSLTSW